MSSKPLYHLGLSTLPPPPPPPSSCSSAHPFPNDSFLFFLLLLIYFLLFHLFPSILVLAIITFLFTSLFMTHAKRPFYLATASSKKFLFVTRVTPFSVFCWLTTEEDRKRVYLHPLSVGSSPHQYDYYCHYHHHHYTASKVPTTTTTTSTTTTTYNTSTSLACYSPVTTLTQYQTTVLFSV